MIGFLEGTLMASLPPTLLLQVGGVGYEIEIPLSALGRLPADGQSCRLYTHLSVREDAHTLFGFLAQSERDLFRILIRVNGVGPRLALSILSHMSPAALVQCIREKDSLALTRLPGVGRKTAERLLLDLQDRLQNFSAEEGEVAMGADSVETAASPARRPAPRLSSAGSEALAALIALGYKETDARRRIAGLESELQESTPEASASLVEQRDWLIRSALQQFGKGH